MRVQRIIDTLKGSDAVRLPEIAKLHDVWIRSMPQSLFILIACILLSGCASYSTPVIDRDFDGITKASEGARVLRVFFIHGMGDHSRQYADPMILQLQKRLQLEPVGLVAERTIKYQGDAVVAAYLRMARFRSRVSGPEVRTYELTWSPLTVSIKDTHLNFDRSPPYPFHRARINKALKETLVDRALADAVLYIGDFGEPMRWTVREGLCHALNDRHTGSGPCSLVDVDIPQLENDQIVFVTASLGSRMLYDTIRKLWEQPATRQFAATAIAKTNMIFMLANQLPLLELGDITAPLHGGAASLSQRQVGLPGFIDAWLKVQRDAGAFDAPGQAAARPLQIVAFSDPNDLLSYTLPEQKIENVVQLVNVIVSNTPEYFWLFALPDRAHTTYYANSVIWDLIICGAKSGKAECRVR